MDLEVPTEIRETLHDAPLEAVAALWKAFEDEYEVEGQRWLARNDRFYLLVRILNRVDCLHPWIYERCREVEASPNGHLDLWAREHFKSSIITYGGAIQEVIKDPEITIGIFSHTKPISKAFLRQIQKEFESNESLRGLFPEIFYFKPEKDSPVWSLDAGITVKRKSNPKEATIEAHGLVDGMPTSKHFKLLIYDDVVVPSSVSTPEQISKTTDAWALSDNLGAVGGEKWMVGTRYCTAGETKILMSDWTHKSICDVVEGEVVVGWELSGGKRWLRPARVVATGSHASQPTNRYTFDHGRSVVCTPDHKWWRGAHGGGPEYAPLDLPGHGRRAKGHKAPAGFLCHIRELLEPIDADQSREAGWLAGFFDGEGTTKKNKNHPSGVVCLTQTMHNPDLIEECRRVLGCLGFAWTESWHSPSKGAKGREHWHDRCVFHVAGGWRERYRFIAQISPAKRRFIAATLFGQLTTTKRKVVAIEDRGLQDVFWLETETGNYVADGFCSKNSYADTYEEVLKRGAASPRLHAATDDGTIDGHPVLFTQELWDKKVRDQGESTIACQMLQNPLAGTQRMFNIEHIETYEIRPSILNVYIMVDPARSKKKGSANTAMIVLGVDYSMNKYLLDGYDAKLDLMQRWQLMLGLYEKWKRMSGVQMIRVGYERYGAISDLQYFEEQMRLTGKRFEIVELEWPREGEGSKIDRIQRLGPDFRSHKFFTPYDTDPKNLTSNQRKVKEQGYEYRIAQPIRRKDETGRVYDLTKVLRNQIHFFPFGGRVDALDAASRVYDMEIIAPRFSEPRYAEPDYI